MKVYVVMVADRHTDTEAHLFSDRDAALRFARAEIEEITGGMFEEITPRRDSGWLYCAAHEVESDSVWVVEKELDA